MSELQSKVEKAIMRLKAFEPPDGYYVAYSGGKDSDVIRILAQLAGVKHELVHNLTTVDAPETQERRTKMYNYFFRPTELDEDVFDEPKPEYAPGYDEFDIADTIIKDIDLREEYL